MKKFRELKEEVSTPPIGVRSLYTKMYAKHGGTASQAKDAQSKAYAEVEKKHGKEMRNSLEAYHKKNMNEEMDNKKHPFVAVHAKKGTHETHASTSYEAAQNAAKHWKMKNTAGIDVYRSDKTHVGEEYSHMNEAVKDKFDIGEYDQEGDMAKSDLRSILANAKRVHDMLEDDDNLPEWVQSKITKAEDYMSTVANYMEAEMNEETAVSKEKVTDFHKKLDTLVHKTFGKRKEEMKEASSAYGRINARFKKLSGSSLEDTAAKHRKEAERLQKEIDAQQAENERRKAAMKTEEVEQLDEKNEPTNPELWARAKSMAKSKFDVYPCVPLDSLAISKKGPISHEELEEGDEILTYNMKEDRLEWKPVLHKHYYENAPLIEIGKSTGFSLKCTPNHKWVVSRTNEKELVEAKDLNTHMKILMCSTLKNESSLLIENWTKKDSWIEKVLSMNEKEREIFLASSVVYDGWDKGLSTKIKGRHTFGFVQKEYDHLWASLLAAYLNGYYVNTSERNDMTGATYIRNKEHHSTQNLYKKDAGNEDVWCPTTENETWVMIQNGLITITGNSAYANGWAAKWYKSKGGGWKSVNEENYEVTVMHTTKDGDKGEHTHKVMNADDARHAKNIALQKHEKMLNSKGLEVRGMGTKTAKVVEAKEDNLPFTPDAPKKKSVVVGKKPEGYSIARQLARQAMQKQIDKMQKKPIKEESRKVKIIKDAAKKEKFESEPIISKTVDDKES